MERHLPWENSAPPSRAGAEKGPPDFSLYAVEKKILDHGPGSPAEKLSEVAAALFAEADSASVGCVDESDLHDALLASQVFHFTSEQASALMRCVKPVTTGFVCDDEFETGFRKHIHRMRKHGENAADGGCFQQDLGLTSPASPTRRVIQRSAVRMSVDSARPIIYQQRQDAEGTGSNGGGLWPSARPREPMFQDGLALSGIRRKSEDTTRRSSMDSRMDMPFRRKQQALSYAMPEIPEKQDSAVDSFATASARHAAVAGGPSRRGPRGRSMDLPRPDPDAISTLRTAVVSRFPPIFSSRGGQKKPRPETDQTDSEAQTAGVAGGRRQSMEGPCRPVPPGGDEERLPPPRTETDMVAGFIKSVITGAHNAKPKVGRGPGHYFVRGRGKVSHAHAPKMVRSQSVAHYLKAFEGMTIAKDGTVKLEDFMRHVREQAPALADHAMNMYEVLQRRSKKRTPGDGLDFTALLSVMFPSASRKELQSLLQMCSKAEPAALEPKASMLNKLQMAKDMFEGWNVSGSGFLSRREAEDGVEEDGVDLDIADLFGRVGTSTQRDYVQFEAFYQWFTDTDLRQMRSMAASCG